MGPLASMMGMGKQLDEDELRMLAAQIGQRTSDGGALSTSSIDQVAKQGLLMQDLGLRMGMGVADQEYRKASLAQDEKDSLRRAKAAQLMAAVSASRGGGSDLDFHKPSNSATEEFEKKSQAVGTVKNLLSRFDSSYSSSLPMTGKIEQWMGKTKWIPSTKGQEEMATWWADWKRDFELVNRHDLFGSALTAGEKSEWAAAYIDSNMSEEVLTERLRTLARLNNKAAAHSVRSAINKDWDPNYVYDEFEQYIPDYVKEAGGTDEALDTWNRRANDINEYGNDLQLGIGSAMEGGKEPSGGEMMDTEDTRAGVLDAQTQGGNPLNQLSTEELRALLMQLKGQGVQP